MLGPGGDGTPTAEPDSRRVCHRQYQDVAGTAGVFSSRSLDRATGYSIRMGNNLTPSNPGLAPPQRDDSLDQENTVA